MTGMGILLRISRCAGMSVSDTRRAGDGATVMSANTETQTSEKSIRTKKVDVVCYLDNPSGLTRRQFADEKLADHDMFERDEFVEDEREVRVELNGRSEKLWSISPDAFEGVDTGDLDVEVTGEKKTEKRFVYDPLQPIKTEFASAIIRAYDDDVIEEQGWAVRSGGDVRGPEYNNVVGVTYEFERIPMLKHKSEIEPDDMYVDEDDDYLAVKVRFVLKELDPEEFDAANDDLLGNAMTELAKHALVRRVRVYDCESEMKETGVCFNV